MRPGSPATNKQRGIMMSKKLKDSPAEQSGEVVTPPIANLLSELYQILGALDAPENVLDQVLAASEGEPLPYESLLPFVAPRDIAE